MDEGQKIQVAKEVLMKYLLPDCLKPEYDGMSAHELARITLKAVGAIED